MNPFVPLLGALGVLAFVLIIGILRSIRIIPARTVAVVERLGKYAHTMEAGFHILVPFIDKVKYRHSLKEQAIDVPTQPCFTQDNVKVEVDGVLYFRVVDPNKASYGISDFRYATIQLAQTMMRSVIGKLEMDRTFEEREQINGAILRNIDQATDPWGVQITRYEIQNIRVPDNILKSMEMQLRAEREKRAVIARSLGEMESRINYSAGVMEEAINRSEGIKEKLVNEAEGRASEIRALAHATAESLSLVARALENEAGDAALVMRISEQYIQELNKLARTGTKLMLPMDLTNINSVLQTVTQMVRESEEQL
ncbi:MAG: paraslipin [Spirochaetales bacterium]|nr:paraslipin [Spirochaetales bacterium]